MRILLLLATLFVAVGCQLAPGGSATSIVTRLPPVIGGLTIPYHENAVVDLAGQRVFFDRAVSAVGGDPRTARVAVGAGPGGLTPTALVVPGADAKSMVETLIIDAGMGDFSRGRAQVGGKDVLFLTRPATTPSRIYIYTAGDMVVVVDTVEPALADEALRALK